MYASLHSIIISLRALVDCTYIYYIAKSVSDARRRRHRAFKYLNSRARV